MPRPPARLASNTDLDLVARTLRRAFEDDPVMRWLIPDARVRDAAMPGFYRALARGTLGHGGLWVADGNERAAQGAALWLPPGAWPVPPWKQLGILPAALRGIGRRVPDAVRLVAAMERRHRRLTEPHWYLEILGSDPDVRGRGYGAAVLEPVLERCDTEGVGAYLESSKADNLPYYERFGWRVVEEFRVRDGAPSLWAMWRPPPGGDPA